MGNILLCDLVDGVPGLVVRDHEPAAPGRGDVRYKVHAIGLNRADLLYLDGAHYVETTYPNRMCYEACGIVDAVGEGVSNFTIGDRVSAIPFNNPDYCVGGEWAITPAAFLAPWPEDFSAAEGASTWMQYMTGYFPLVEGARVRPGDNVLITAASSSAGVAAIQLTKLMGGISIATSRTDSKRDFLIHMGADHVVVTEKGHVAEHILYATGGAGVRIVYDAIAGSFMNQYADALAREARIFIYGALDGEAKVECDILPLVRKGATIEAYSLFNHMMDPGAVDRGRRFVMLAINAGALRPVVDRIFPLHRASEAYDYMKSGVQKGKIVLRTGSERNI